MKAPTETIIDRARKYTKAMGVERLGAMQAALELLDEKGVEGDVVECGVWKGGHIVLSRLVSPTRVCWCYDTFDGMTPPGPEDVKVSNGRKAPDKRGMSRATLAEVKDIFATEKILDDRLVRFVVGDVADTLRKPANLPAKIALLRLDTDWYVSTKVELEILYPLLVPGGVLIVDDYGHWAGARKAVQEYFAKTGWDARGLTEIDYTAVMMVKPP